MLIRVKANLERIGGEGEVDEGVANLYFLKLHLQPKNWECLLHYFLILRRFFSGANLFLPPLPCGHSHRKTLARQTFLKKPHIEQELHWIWTTCSQANWKSVLARVSSDFPADSLAADLRKKDDMSRHFMASLFLGIVHSGQPDCQPAQAVSKTRQQ